ncbi:MAG: hypothetical protein AAFX01_02785 [Cyanobacteria bacterium J06638_28]
MSNARVQSDNYDPNLIPAETAARKEREQEDYKQVPEQSAGDIDTAGGYTVDQEGLVNNYAIEPEMYVEEPGDLREENAKEEAARARDLKEVNETDEQGDLTLQSDNRGKGVGII